MNTSKEPPSAADGPSRRDIMGAAGALAATPLAASGLVASAVGVSPAIAARRRGGGGAANATFWPNGARLAIALTLVMETGADTPPELKAPDGAKFPDLFARSADAYSTNEAIPRVLDLFERRGVSATALVCGASAEKFPQLVKEIADRGHECAAHGKTHANQFQMSRDDERAFIQGAVDILTKIAGKRPLGWNSRAQARSENTLSLLQELGFIYHVDDVSRDEPFVATVDSKPFVTVPYTQHLTDFSFFNHGNGSSDVFERELKLEFDALYAEAAVRRRMMAVTIHDSVARPARVRAIENFLVYAQGHKGVWPTRCDAIADWTKSNSGSASRPTPT